MNKRKRPRLLCFIISIFLWIAHFNAITSYAAPLSSSDSSKIISAIQSTEQSNSQKFYSNLTNSSTVYVRSFEITNVSAPVHGQLLDNTATVVSDNGVTWDIPVIWINKDGDIMHVAIEIDDIIRSYPIFVFYMPDGYSLLFGENATYDIRMPDFAVNLMNENGVAALSIPEAGRTYISCLLPNTNNFKINYASPISYDMNEVDSMAPPENYNNDHSSGDEDTNKEAGGDEPGDDEPGGDEPGGDKPGGDEPGGDEPGGDEPGGDEPGGDEPGGDEPGGDEPPITPPTDNETTPPDSGLSSEAKQQLVEAHCDSYVINKIGVDNLASLVQWVKTTLEPEATNLLLNKFPAYKSASENDELGKDLGIYVFLNRYYDRDGTYEGKSVVGIADWDRIYTGDIKYKIGINTNYFYTHDQVTDEAVWDESTGYEWMDSTIVHEMMHVYMYDYTRPGMTSMRYNASTDMIIGGTDPRVEYPKWFKEGMASTVNSNYQFRNNTFLTSTYGYNATKNEYIAADLQQSYSNNRSIRIGDADTAYSNYVSGYLACLYLGYLAAQSQGSEAISGDRVDSSVILSGENYILEQLHNGKTLNEIITEISTDSSGTALYSNYEEFEDGFISDGGSSLSFCTTLLNYLQSNSNDGNIANGSVLIDFSDTNTALLSKSLLDQGQTIYVPTDSKEQTLSTVDKVEALKAGGLTLPGTFGVSQDTTNSLASETVDLIAALEPEKEVDAFINNNDQPEDEIEISIDDIEQNSTSSEHSDYQNDSEILEESAEKEVVVEESQEQEDEQSSESKIDQENADEAQPIEQELQNTNDNASLETSNGEDSNEQSSEDLSLIQNEEASPDDAVAPEVTPEEALDITITEDVSPDAPINGIIISEAEPQEDNNSTDDSASEQVLDAIPEASSDDETQIEAETAETE